MVIIVISSIFMDIYGTIPCLDLWGYLPWNYGYPLTLRGMIHVPRQELLQQIQSTEPHFIRSLPY
jgi:hypothetical protein